MKGKTDYSKADKQRRMLIHGHEPISKDYAEFPPKVQPDGNNQPADAVDKTVDRRPAEPT